LANHSDPGDTFSQHTIGILNIVEPATIESSQLAWENAPTHTIRLRELADIYRRKERQRAIQCLNRKIHIRIDKEYILNVKDTVFQHTFALDFFSAVPRECGFSVILPPEDYEAGFSWNFDLYLNRPSRPFYFKHGMLGVHCEGATIWVGRNGSLDIWAIFAREDELHPDATPLKAGTPFSSSTQLSRRHFRQFCSWILHLLVGVNYPGIWCGEDDLYNVNLDGSSADWSFAVGFKYV